MVPVLLFLWFFVLQERVATPSIDRATLTVEREAFCEAQSCQYGPVGRFDGFGMIYFSPGDLANTLSLQCA